jgi:peptide/nickel transport system substrate-binding protein
MIPTGSPRPVRATSATTSPRRRARARSVAVLLAVVAVLAASCSGGDSKGDTTSASGAGAGTPVTGGKVVYGLEAETLGGWCLPESTLAISGIMVARAIYDTLVTPNDQGEFVPFLARSLEHNADFTEWTLTVRDGVTFHDGSPLTAQVVKNNLDAFLGRYPARKPLLFPFVLKPIRSVDVVDASTVRITTDRPWPALPAYLYGGGRLGIMAQAQLDDPDTCDTKLIGTGPFKLQQWAVNDHLSATRNPSYWAKDGAGRALPYLDAIEFRPIPDSDARLNAFLAGELDMLHTSAAPAVQTLEGERDNGNIGLIQTLSNTEVSFLMLNASRPPFDSPVARQAVARALDRDLYERVRSLGLFPMASGPFPPGSPGHLDDAGFPTYDLAQAKKLVAQYEAESGKKFEFSYVFSADSESSRNAQFLQEQFAKAGITVNLSPVEQATLINTALGSNWDMIPYRNYPGGVPDGNYVWWYGGSPVNFGKFKDPRIDSLLDAGRVEADPAKAEAIYQDVNREFGTQAYNIWLDWTEWNIASAKGIGGVMGPDLPDGSRPSKALATGHSVAGIWKRSSGS